MEKSREGRYGLQYHLVPPYGLMNDPNGLVFFKGYYHVFFQWNPTDCKHANKHWGHLRSKDMTHWERLSLALAPDSWFDKSGVYSGSAFVKDDELWLFYTGNVKDEEGNASSYQCLAISTDGIHFEKKGPLFEHPKGFTRHVRDPKVWYDERVGHYWMVVGAQHDTLQGDTLVYRSDNLVDWTLSGSIVEAFSPLGYMWECPDIVRLPEKDAFIFSPQGLDAQGERFNNVYQTVYQLGKFTTEGHFAADAPLEVTELDAGFDFYAPQTFVTPDERVVLYGWMGIPEGNEMQIPTIQEGWIHALTIPRVLSTKANILLQQPVSELEALRTNSVQVMWSDTKFDTVLPTKSQELQIIWKEPVREEIVGRIFQEVEFRYHPETQQMSWQRTNWETGEREERVRTLHHSLQQIHAFVDGSSVEFFINGGEEVASLRYFDAGNSMDFQIQQTIPQEMSITTWTLDGANFIR